MDISATQVAPSRARAARYSAAAETGPPRSGASVAAHDPSYTGPADGGSHYDKRLGGFFGALNRHGFDLVTERSVEGQENIPRGGPHMIAFNHTSMMDPPLVASLTKFDIRFMAAKNQFSGIAGKVMTAMGAFPVERGKNVTRPIEVATQLLDDGKGVGIFPEGGIFRQGDVQPLKEGTARIALASACETIVPGAIRYEPSPLRLGTTIGACALSAAVVAGGIAARCIGGPLAAVAGGLATGILAGLPGGAAAGFGLGRLRRVTDPKRIFSHTAFSGIAGAAAGAVLGVGGALLGPYLALGVAIPLSICAGVAVLGAGLALARRGRARVAVGQPIEVAPYRRMADRREAQKLLTSDLHTAMSRLKSRLDQKSTAPLRVGATRGDAESDVSGAENSEPVVKQGM